MSRPLLILLLLVLVVVGVVVALASIDTARAPTTVEKPVLNDALAK